MNKKIIIVISVFILIIITVFLYKEMVRKNEIVTVKIIEGYNYLLNEDILVKDKNDFDRIEELINTSFALPGEVDINLPADIELKIIYTDKSEKIIGLYINQDNNQIRMIMHNDTGVYYYIAEKWMKFIVEAFKL
jgi:hypothetical protein